MPTYSRRTFTLAFAAACNLAANNVLHAGDPCCAQCGCGGCEKVCRLVCEEKKVTVTCWGCKCEDFCVGGPSHVKCEHCGEVCGQCQCDPKTPFSLSKPFVWKEWVPGCAKEVLTKKKLMKKTVTKTVPSFKWVVEDLCPRCEGKCQGVQIPPDAKIPPPPKVSARVIDGKREK